MVLVLLVLVGRVEAQDASAEPRQDGDVAAEESPAEVEEESSPEVAEESEVVPDVVALFHEGLEAYRTGRYSEAELLFERAHRVEPIADLSYNRARALENLGRLEEAADVYQRYLNEAPESPDREAIEARIGNLRARAAAAESQLETDPVSTGPAAPSGSPSSLIGPLLVLSGGVGLMLVGTGTGIAASSAHDQALDPSTNQPDTLDANERADRRARWTNALFVVGGAAVAAGAAWLIIRVLRGPKQPAGVEVGVGATGLSVRGTF